MQRYEFTILGTLPGLNEYSDAERKNWRMAAAMKRQAESVIKKYAKAKLGCLHITKPVRIDYLWICPNRRRDKSNIAFAKKFIEDGLIGAKILKNDGWFDVVDFSDKFGLDKKNPRIIVTITEVDDH